MTSRLRILYMGDCNNAHTGRWVSALERRGHVVHLFSFTIPRDGVSLMDDPDRFSSLGMDPRFPKTARGIASKWRYLWAVPRLRKVFRGFRPDVVNAHYVSSYGIVAALSGIQPLVTSVWGYDIYDWPKRSVVHSTTVRWALNSAVSVLSTSEAMAKVTSRYTTTPIRVTPFGVDTESFSDAGLNSRATGTGRKFVIGTVKALETKYGIEFLIRAAAHLGQAYARTDFEVRIFGEGSLRNELETLARELGVSEQIRFLGLIPNASVPDAFREMDVAVFPSIHDSESFGVAAIEAQACGIPVIASRVGGLPEVVLEGITGIIIPPRDPEELAEAIVKLWDSDSLRLEMGRAARQHVLEFYDLEHCVSLMESAYENAIRQYMKA